MLVLSENSPATAEDGTVIRKTASEADLERTLLALTGNPRYPGPRAIVPISRSV